MTERPGGAPFVNHLPQEVIDRFEASQRTAAKEAEEPDPEDGENS